MPALYVEVTDKPLEDIKWTVKEGADKGKPRHMRRQTIYLWQGDRFPTDFEVMHDGADLGYKPGFYLVGPGSFERTVSVGQNGRGSAKLGISRAGLQLTPIAEAMASLAELAGTAKPEPLRKVG